MAHTVNSTQSCQGIQAAITWLVKCKHKCLFGRLKTQIYQDTVLKRLFEGMMPDSSIK